MLIAPPTYEDTEASVVGEAGVGLCSADSVLGAEPADVPGAATCASAGAPEALLVISLYFILL